MAGRRPLVRAVEVVGVLGCPAGRRRDGRPGAGPWRSLLPGEDESQGMGNRSGRWERDLALVPMESGQLARRDTGRRGDIGECVALFECFSESIPENFLHVGHSLHVFLSIFWGACDVAIVASGVLVCGCAFPIPP